mgnify:CR=1 FL=1
MEKIVLKDGTVIYRINWDLLNEPIDFEEE